MIIPIRLAIAGVGNCASSLVQGITYYRDARPEEVVPGLMIVLTVLSLNVFGDGLRDAQPALCDVLCSRY